MSRRDVREDSFASPLRARSLLTVRAAISLARFVEAPLFFSLSLMCSYWRSRLLLHAFCGIENLPSWTFPTHLCPFPGVSIAAAGAQSARIRLESERLCPIASVSGGGRNYGVPTLGGDVGRGRPLSLRAADSERCARSRTRS